MPRASRQAEPGSSFELYARAMLDHWLGKTATVEFEREDGYRDASRIDTYFAPPSKWKKGFDVVGIDASATQVALARIRGVLQVYPASVHRLPRGLGTFDTVLMMGNNLGLAGDVPRVRRFLRDLREITRKGARLIGHSRIPGTWSEDHLPYVKSNIRRKRPPGLITLRVRYKGRVGDWFDLLLISPDAFAALAHETGWDLVRVIGEGGYTPGDYIAVAERR